MSERHWQRPALAATALALLAAATVAGCGNSASTSQASATQTAGVAAATGHKSFTAAQLKRALLTRVGGARPAAPAEAGDYGGHAGRAHEPAEHAWPQGHPGHVRRGHDGRFQLIGIRPRPRVGGDLQGRPGWRVRGARRGDAGDRDGGAGKQAAAAARTTPRR